MYRKIIGLSFALSILLLGFQNCAKKKNGNEDTAASTQAVLQAKSLELLQQKCASCHSGTNAYANAVPGNDAITDIANVDYLLSSRLLIPGEPEISPLFASSQTGDMPPDQPLSADEILLLRNWITDFNKQESTGGGLQVIAPGPTYSYLRTNVFLSKCYVCHVNRAIHLDTFASVTGAIANNRLRDRVNRLAGVAAMPPNGATQLTTQEKTYLLQWIDAGAPNN